jgi:hypothetical protein
MYRRTHRRRTYRRTRRRTHPGTHPGTNITVLNNDTENIITSYIPDIQRWKPLRELYNDSFLREGLQKKTVVQLTLIQRNLIEMVVTGELSGIITFFQTHGLDIDELKTRKRICSSTNNKWKSILGNKKEKIEKIIKFIHRLGNIIHLNVFDCLDYIGRGRGFILNKYQLNPKLQDIYAPKALKVLHLLVSILKNPKKTGRKVTVN